MDYFQDILTYQVAQNTMQDFLIALGLFVGLFIVFRIFKSIVVARLKKLATKTANNFDDVLIEVIQGISWVFYLVVALYFPLKTLAFGEVFEKWLNGIFIVIVVWQVIRFILSLIEYGLGNFAEKKGAKTAFSGVRLVLKIVLWSIGLLLILSNLGFNVTSLVASLGIGGIAIALAVQNILGDVLSSFSLYFDKPFQVGDFIVLGENKGTVKKIGLKTTRLETLQGEELVISNNELTSSKIQNFKKMKKRRIVMNFGVVYETNSKKLKKINDIVKKIIDKTKDVDFDRSHFKEFGDFSLNFEVIFYVLSADYVDYMDKQQEINFAIKEAFEKEKIEMAYPTQTVYVSK